MYRVYYIAFVVPYSFLSGLKLGPVNEWKYVTLENGVGQSKLLINPAAAEFLLT